MCSPSGVCLFLSLLAAADEPRSEHAFGWYLGVPTRRGTCGSTHRRHAGRLVPCPVTCRGQTTSGRGFVVSFAVPDAMRGQRIKLHFGGVKYNSRVYVNGQHVGGCFGGYEAFDVDVTSAVRFDGPNELAVGCHDWTGVFTPERVAFPAQRHVGCAPRRTAGQDPLADRRPVRSVRDLGRGDAAGSSGGLCPGCVRQAVGAPA